MESPTSFSLESCDVDMSDMQRETNTDKVLRSNEMLCTHQVDKVEVMQQQQQQQQHEDEQSYEDEGVPTTVEHSTSFDGERSVDDAELDTDDSHCITSPFATQEITATLLHQHPLSGDVVWLRGPLLIGTVILASILPYLRYLSVTSVVRVVLILTGVRFCWQDAHRVLVHNARLYMRLHINRFVLDDCMRNWLDPVTGWIACMVGTATGNAAMYALPCSDEQRVALVQSALELTNQHQAAVILQQAGGIKELLPRNIKDWLDQEDEDWEDEEEVSTNLSRSVLAAGGWNTKTLEANSPAPTTKTEATADDGESHSTASDLLHGHDLFGQAPRGEAAATSEDYEGDTGRQSEPNPNAPRAPLPHEVMSNIVQEMLMQRGKQLLNSLPVGTVERTGLVAAAFLLIQFRYSRRSRQVLWGLLQGSATLSVSGVLAVCLATVAAKHQYGEQEGAGSSLSLLRTVAVTMQLLLRRGSKWKDYIAILIMRYLGRKRATGGADR